MSFRENTANWQWRYFAAPEMPAVLENITGFIDESIALPDGRTVKGENFNFSEAGMLDMYEIIQPRPKTLARTILTADFTADCDGALLLGIAADWMWAFYFNGSLVLDARVCANSEAPIRPDNHLQEICYKKGRNQVVFEIFGGGTFMTTACKIMEVPEKLTMKYKPFISYPDAEYNAISVIFTANRKTPAAVDYRLQGTEEWTRVYDNLGGQARHDRAVHHIRLTDLQPGSVYEYKAVLIDDCRALEEYPFEIDTFKTAPVSGDFRFSVTADLQNPATRRSFLEGLVGKNNTFKPDFMAFCGDLFWTTDYDLSVMDEFIVPYREVTENHLPLVMVRGNHEIYGKDSNRFFEYFTAPDPGREAYYMFRWGEVCFLVLDFCDDHPRQAPPSTRQYHDFEPYLAAEAKWLKNAINLPMCRDAKYRIVLAHGIPVGDGREYMPNHVRQVIDPVLKGENPQLQIHLWLGGHVHRPFRSIPLKNACYSMLKPEDFLGGSLPPLGVNYNFPVVITGGPTRKLGDNMQFTSIDVEVSEKCLTVHSRDRYQNEFDCVTITPDGVITEVKRNEEFRYYEY